MTDDKLSAEELSQLTALKGDERVEEMKASYGCDLEADRKYYCKSGYLGKPGRSARTRVEIDGQPTAEQAIAEAYAEFNSLISDGWEHVD